MVLHLVQSIKFYKINEFKSSVKSRDGRWDWNPGTWDCDRESFSWDVSELDKYCRDSPGVKISGAAKSQALSLFKDYCLIGIFLVPGDQSGFSSVVSIYAYMHTRISQKNNFIFVTIIMNEFNLK